MLNCSFRPVIVQAVCPTDRDRITDRPSIETERQMLQQHWTWCQIFFATKHNSKSSQKHVLLIIILFTIIFIEYQQNAFMCSIPKHNVTHCAHPDSSWVTASIHPFLIIPSFSATEKPHQEFLWILSTFKPWKYFFQGCHPGIVSFAQPKLFILASAAVMCDWGTKFLSVSTHILS